MPEAIAIDLAPAPLSAAPASASIASVAQTDVSELLSSAFRGDVYAVSKLLDEKKDAGLCVNSTDYDKRSALHLAAAEGALECVKLLVKRGASINCKDRWNGTPIDDAIRHNHKEVTDYLIANGGKPGDDRVATARLFEVVEKGEANALATIIAAGVNVKAVDYDMRTALHVATANGHTECIQQLVHAGADVNALDNFGLTPLGEATRHGTRTGENKIRDMLLSLGAVESEAPLSSRFIVIVSALQFLFLVLFTAFTKYGSSTESPTESPERIKTTYGMFQDVHVMIFIGFGFLMTFLRKYGYSAVGLNFLVSAFVIQWHLIWGDFVHQMFDSDTDFHMIELDLNSILLADFATAAVLITFGALLGKVTPVQLLVLGFLEIIFFSLNEAILLKIGIMDVGGSIVVHVFGAYFGLAASWILTKKEAMDDPQNASTYHSDLFAMVGSVFLFVFWPSFVASPASEYDQERCIIATLLSLCASCVSAFIVSQMTRGGYFCMVDVQNATLAGGVAIGTSANIAVLSPAEAIAIGITAGVLSVVGYTKIQPKLENAIGLHDTCGVNNLHGMPGILAAVWSAIIIGYSGKAENFASLEHFAAVYGPLEITGNFTSGEVTYSRSAGAQAGFQLLCLVVSFAIAIASGLLSAFIVKFIDDLGKTRQFVDSAAWEVPELEIPFYFDQRGEINRETLEALVVSPRLTSGHGGELARRLSAGNGGGGAFEVQNGVNGGGHASANSGRDAFSNELINMKLDLLMQAVVRVGATDSKTKEV